MRRLALLGLLTLLPGCTGFGEFVRHTFTAPGVNPNLPMADSENVRRALGQVADVEPLVPEAGNVWPGAPPPNPTLQDVARDDPGNTARRGFEPTTVPGAEPGLPAGRQPRPAARGSSTPPGSVQPGADPLPREGVLPQAPRGAAQPRLPGGVVQTPRGAGVDAGGTSTFRQLNVPGQGSSIIVPNGNGTSTIIAPDGSVSTVPTPR